MFSIGITLSQMYYMLQITIILNIILLIFIAWELDKWNAIHIDESVRIALLISAKRQECLPSPRKHWKRPTFRIPSASKQRIVLESMWYECSTPRAPGTNREPFVFRIFEKSDHVGEKSKNVRRCRRRHGRVGRRALCGIRLYSI